MRYLHLLVATLFLLFAYWQLNDPDWYLWIPAYILVALLTGWHTFGRPPRQFLQITLGLFVVWAMTRIPDLIDWFRQGTPSIVEEMQADQPHIELTREFLGIGICLVTLLIYYFRFHRKQ